MKKSSQRYAYLSPISFTDLLVLGNLKFNIKVLITHNQKGKTISINNGTIHKKIKCLEGTPSINLIVETLNKYNLKVDQWRLESDFFNIESVIGEDALFNIQGNKDIVHALIDRMTDIWCLPGKKVKTKDANRITFGSLYEISNQGEIKILESISDKNHLIAYLINESQYLADDNLPFVKTRLCFSRG